MAISYGTYTITEVQEGSQIWTSSAAPTTPNYTFDVSKLMGDSETSIKSGDIIMHSYNRYTVLSISSDGKTVLAGNLQSIRGATGAASVTYALIVSNLAVVKDKNGNLSPSTITVTAKSQTGSNAMANYTGRIKIETTTNNSTWTSRINEDAATKTYTIPNDTVAIRCSLYLKGGTTTLLDQQTVPVVSDGTDGINGTNGKDGADGKDAYTIILTNENHTFAGNTTSAIASEIECNVIAYKGTTQIAATIGTITGQPTGMTTSLLNNGTVNSAFEVTVTTSMVTRNGVLNIPITVDGKTFTKKFTYSLVLKGTSGTSENLLMDVYVPSLEKVDAPWDRYLSDAGNSSITGEFIAEENLPDPNATHFYRITDSSASTYGRGYCFYNNGTPPFLEGNTYRMGCWVRSHSGEPQISFTLGGSLGSWLVKRKVSNTEWEWVEAVRTFGNSNAIDGTPAVSYKRLYFYFYNNNIEGTSLDMCGFRLERVNVDNGTARNILRKTETLDGWTTTNGATINNGIVTFPASTSDVFRGLEYPSSNINYSIVRNKYCILSMKVKANIGERCCVSVESGFTDTETNKLLRKYKTHNIYFTGTGEWQTICASELLTDYSFTDGTGTVDFDNCWFRLNLYAQRNYHNGFQLKEPQLCLGTDATSWTPAPEDIEEEIASKADSSVAVEEEQLIYISKASGTNTVTGTTTWITETGDVQNTWTTKRPTYDSGYPVLFIAKQKKTVSGTVTCTTPLKDDTTTVIDGGHITTGTIDASQVTVTNIDASKITTGKLNANVIEANSLSISHINGLQTSLNGKQPTGDYATNSDVTTAIDNIEIGGRNLVWNSNFHLPVEGTWANWGSPITREIVTIDGENWMHIVTTANAFQGYSQNQANRNGFGEIQAGEQIVFSFDAYSKVDGQKACIGIHWRNSNDTNVNQDWTSFDLTTIKKRYVTKVFTVPNNVVGFNIMVGQSVATAQEMWITNIKGEKGNKATTWSPAPEDINKMVTTVQTNTDAVNLSPFFSYSPYESNDYWRDWTKYNGFTYTDMGNGWMHVQYTNTDSSIVRRDFKAYPNTEIKEGVDYTFLIEFRNNRSNTTGSSSGSDFYIVEHANCQFWGSSIKENIEGKGSTSSTSLITHVPVVGTTVDGVEITKDYVYKKRFIKTSEKTGSSHWTDGSADNLVGFVTLVTRCGANTTIDYEVRISLYEGKYLGEYKPYVDSAASGKIEDAKKVATNYLAIDNTGIMVADMKNGQQTPSGILSGNNVFIDNTSVNIREGQKELASFGVDGIQIGLDNETRTEQDYHSWKMIDKDDNTYAFVSDLRDENGEVTITETAKPSESTSWFETNFEISSIISVTVNGEEPESYQKMLSRLIDITPQPTDEDVVVVTYISQSPQLKAYTFGKRIQDSNIGGYSFVEGVNNVASGYTSHAEGNSNTSSGEASHVEGVLNAAQGFASHAQNFHTTASSDYQTTIGKYNVDDPNNQYAFIIGNGGPNRVIHEFDYSNALGVRWNGNMEIGGGMFGTLVEKPEHELPTRTPIPLFKTVSWSGNDSDNWNNVTIAKNSAWSRVGFNIYQKGYRALGVVGFGVYPALTNPANTDWCIITRCYTWYNSNIITEDNHIGADTLDVCVWNQHQSQSAKVRIFVRVLYIAESALVGVLEPGTP